MCTMCAVFIKFCVLNFILSVRFAHLFIYSSVSLFIYSQVCAAIQAEVKARSHLPVSFSVSTSPSSPSPSQNLELSVLAWLSDSKPPGSCSSAVMDTGCHVKVFCGLWGSELLSYGLTANTLPCEASLLPLALIFCYSPVCSQPRAPPRLQHNPLKHSDQLPSPTEPRGHTRTG